MPGIQIKWSPVSYYSSIQTAKFLLIEMELHFLQNRSPACQSKGPF